MAEISLATDEQVIAVLASRQGLQTLVGGMAVTKNKRGIRQGDPVAKQTTTNELQVAKISQVATEAAALQANVIVDDAHPFEVGDVVTMDEGNADDEDVTISSINYETNTLTMTGNLTNAHEVDVSVSVETTALDEVIGIALTAVLDKSAYASGLVVDVVTPKLRTVVLGEIAITGVFKTAALKNFLIGGFIDTKLGGLENPENGTYIVTTPPAYSI